MPSSIILPFFAQWVLRLIISRVFIERHENRKNWMHIAQTKEAIKCCNPLTARKKPSSQCVRRINVELDRNLTFIEMETRHIVARALTLQTIVRIVWIPPLLNLVQLLNSTVKNTASERQNRFMNNSSQAQRKLLPSLAFSVIKVVIFFGMKF